MFKKVTSTLTALFSASTFAVCFPDLVDYSLESEVKRSPVIIVATPIGQQWVTDTHEPDFYAGAIYQLQIHQTLYSKVQGEITLWDPNDSGRFAPDIGEKYLLFLSQNAKGLYTADYCGNSGVLEENLELLPIISELVNR